jgi:hypothetical protein
MAGIGAQPDIDEIRAFLERGLPPASRKDAPYLASRLVTAAARYDRYSSRRGEWLDYSRRRGHLEQIAALSEKLTSYITDLDSLSHDDLTRQLGAERLSSLIESLLAVRGEADYLANRVQKSGRPRDLAEERWILEVADIYRIAFGKPPRVSGSGTGSEKRRGKFYDLLSLCRPESFPRHGKLSPKQIDRVIKGRRKSELIFRLGDLV